jgi:hypothetical protein
MTFFTFQQGFTQDYTSIGAAGVIMLLFLALQRRFIEGISASGLGGGNGDPALVGHAGALCARIARRAPTRVGQTTTFSACILAMVSAS